jgi:hypothetical protein
MIESDLFAYLSSCSALTNLLATPPAPAVVSIYPVKAPDVAPDPYIEYAIISPGISYTLDGPTSLTKPRIQFGIYAATMTLAIQIYEALAGALNTWRAVNNQVQGVYIETESETFVPSTHRLYSIPMDIFVWYQT